MTICTIHFCIWFGFYQFIPLSTISIHIVFGIFFHSKYCCIFPFLFVILLCYRFDFIRCNYFFLSIHCIFSVIISFYIQFYVLPLNYSIMSIIHSFNYIQFPSFAVSLLFQLHHSIYWFQFVTLILFTFNIQFHLSIHCMVCLCISIFNFFCTV